MATTAEATPEAERAQGEGRERRRHWVWGLAIVALLGLCLFAFGLGWPPAAMTISSGEPGDVYFNLSDALTDFLNDAFPGFPNGRQIVFTNLTSRGAEENVARIRRGEAQIALAEEGIDLTMAEPPTQGNAAEPIEVRTLVQLFSSPLKIISRLDIALPGKREGVHIETLSDLKLLTEIRTLAKAPPIKAYLGAEGSGTRSVVRIVLAHYGFAAGPAGAEPGPLDLESVGQDWTFARAKEALERNEIQVAFFLTNYGTEAVKQLSGKGGFAMLEVDRAEGIHRSHPFLDVVAIPPAAYPSPVKFPPRETKTLAVDEVLIGSSTLSDGEAYRIVQAMFLHSHELGSTFQFLTPLSKAQQLSQRYFYPPHPGATAFYQDRPEPGGLQDFFQRYRDAILVLFSVSGTALTVYHFFARRARSLPLAKQLERAVSRETVLAVEAEATRLFASKKIDKETYEALKEYIRVCLARFDPS